MSDSVQQIEVKKLLVCGELMFSAGEIVDAKKRLDGGYIVFLRNGWWFVPSEYFDSVESD